MSSNIKFVSKNDNKNVVEKKSTFTPKVSSASVSKKVTISSNFTVSRIKRENA